MNGTPILGRGQLLDGWLVTHAFGRLLIGKPHYAPADLNAAATTNELVALGPVYELQPGLAGNGQGQVWQQINVGPPLGLLTIERLPIPPGAWTMRYQDLAKGERQAVQNGVEGITKIIRELRAKSEGLELPPPGALLKTTH